MSDYSGKKERAEVTSQLGERIRCRADKPALAHNVQASFNIPCESETVVDGTALLTF